MVQTAAEALATEKLRIAIPSLRPNCKLTNFANLAFVSANWDTAWGILPTQGEIDAEYDRLLPSLTPLNWRAAKRHLINLTPNSAYMQLTTWANTNVGFSTSRLNILSPLNARDDDDIREEWLKAALTDLHLKTQPPYLFTPAQIAEIDAALTALGVTWRWADLAIARS